MMSPFWVGIRQEVELPSTMITALLRLLRRYRERLSFYENFVIGKRLRNPDGSTFIWSDDDVAVLHQEIADLDAEIVELEQIIA